MNLIKLLFFYKGCLCLSIPKSSLSWVDLGTGKLINRAWLSFYISVLRNRITCSFQLNKKRVVSYTCCVLYFHYAAQSGAPLTGFRAVCQSEWHLRPSISLCFAVPSSVSLITGSVKQLAQTLCLEIQQTWYNLTLTITLTLHSEQSLRNIVIRYHS